MAESLVSVAQGSPCAQLSSQSGSTMQRSLCFKLFPISHPRTLMPHSVNYVEYPAEIEGYIHEQVNAEQNLQHVPNVLNPFSIGCVTSCEAVHRSRCQRGYSESFSRKTAEISANCIVSGSKVGACIMAPSSQLTFLFRSWNVECYAFSPPIHPSTCKIAGLRRGPRTTAM